MKHCDNHLPEILKAARKLFVRRAYSGTSMSEIASATKITKAALYYHFPSKQDLYLSVLEKDFEDFQKSIGEIIFDKKNSSDCLKEKTSKVAAGIYSFMEKKLDIMSHFASRIDKDWDEEKARNLLHKYKKASLETLRPLSEEIAKQKSKTEKINHEDISLLILSFVNSRLIKCLSENAPIKKTNSLQAGKKIAAIIFN